MLVSPHSTVPGGLAVAGRHPGDPEVDVGKDLGHLGAGGERAQHRTARRHPEGVENPERLEVHVALSEQRFQRRLRAVGRGRQ